MSVTFTPIQSWIALAMFGILVVFSIYNLFLNIASDQRIDEARLLADQRSINATKDRQATLDKIDKDTILSQNATRDLNTLLTNTKGIGETVQFFLERHDATVKNLIIEDIRTRNATLADELQKDLQAQSGSTLKLVK